MDNHQFDRCMALINQGDRSGLKEIYEAYVAYIYAIMYSILRSRENAEDLTTEFFVKLWQRSDQYRKGKGHKTWLTTIARNMAIDYMRAREREQVTENISDKASALSVSTEEHVSSPEEQVVAEMSFKETLSILPEDERVIVTLKIAGDMTFKEIAKLMGMPMGTITWKYQNSMERLRRAVV